MLDDCFLCNNIKVTKGIGTFLKSHQVVHIVIAGLKWLRSFQIYFDLFLPGPNQSRIYGRISLQNPKSTFHENPAGKCVYKHLHTFIYNTESRTKLTHTYTYMKIHGKVVGPT